MDRHKSSGFSLIELLAALAVVAILASITIPAYGDFIAKSRRIDAITTLLNIQLQQERWRAGHLVYATSMDELVGGDMSSATEHYSFRLESADSSGFLAVAKPLGAQRVDKCGVYALDQSGPVFTQGFATPACWQR